MKGIALLLLMLGAGLVWLGCGTEEPPATAAGGSPASSSGSPGRLDLVFGDCSSFRAHSQRYVGEMVAVAQSGASLDRLLYAGCMDGAPLRTIDWTVKIDFAALAARVPGASDTTVDRLKAARALGAEKQLEDMLEEPPEVTGSGQLEALEVASQAQGLGRAWLFTDGIINQIEGTNLKRATSADVERLAERWIPRLGDGLDGVTVTFVGVGRGAPTSRAVRNAELLFRSVVKGSGGHFVWSQTTAFPPEG